MASLFSTMLGVSLANIIMFSLLADIHHPMVITNAGLFIFSILVIVIRSVIIKPDARS